MGPFPILFQIVFYACSVAYLALGLTKLPITWQLTSFRPFAFDDFLLTIILSSVASFAHCVIVCGLRNAITFILSIVISVILCEIYGLRTGNLFGEYYFEPGRMGPMLTAELPLIVPFAWYSALYPCSFCANVILSFPSNSDSVIFPALAWIVSSATLATASDIVSDPILSSSGGHLKWSYSSVDEMPPDLSRVGDFTYNTSAYPANMLFFGVPLQNFLGWAITSSLGFTGVRLFCGEIVCTVPSRKRATRLIVLDISIVAVYFGTGVFYAIHNNHLPASRLLAVLLINLPSFLALCQLLTQISIPFKVE